MNKNIKYPFPAPAILFFIASFFYFLALVFTEDVSYEFYPLFIPAFIRFVSVIAIGVFLLIKRLHIANLVCLCPLLIAQFTDMVIYADAGSYYLYDGDIILMIVKDFFVLSAIIFVILLSLTNVANGSFKKFRKVWFIGIILSAVAYFFDFLVTVIMLDYLPYELEDVLVPNLFGNILLCVGLCLCTRWFKVVAENQCKKPDEVYVYQPTFTPPKAAPVYNPPVYNGYNAYTPAEPVKTTDDAQELRKYKALLDEGVITREEFDKKKQQILKL